MPRSVGQRFPGADASVPEARSFLRHVLSEWEVTDRADDMLTGVSELATNAVRHGLPPGGRFAVEVSLDDGCLRIEVHDATWRHPRMSRPTAEATAGRGLLLVNALADVWGVKPHAVSGKTVWTEFKVKTRQELPSGATRC